VEADQAAIALAARDGGDDEHRRIERTSQSDEGRRHGGIVPRP